MFITFEGIDGSGKSLQAKRIFTLLKEAGQDVILTREPGGTEGAEALRELVLNGDTDRWSAISEALIFNAARRDHCERVIWPALECGQVVVCDRFADSTRLYQGLESPELRQAVDQIHNIAIHTEPDLTLIFDMEPSQAFARMASREDSDMRFEGHGLAFQERRRAGFHELIKQYSDRCVLINADQPIDKVTTDCIEIIQKRLGNGRG